MKSTHRYEIWPEKLTPHELWQGVCAFADERKMKVAGTGYFKMEFDPFEEIHTDSLQEFLRISERMPRYEVIVTRQAFGKEDTATFFEIYIDWRRNMISIDIESTNIDLVAAVHAYCASTFQLRKRSLPLASPSRARYPQPKIFLGRHFDASGDKSAASLRRFLHLLGFDVVEGERYTSQTIPEKVRSRIDDQALYLALITTARTHDWLTAEAAYALGKDKHVVLLVEEGAKFNPTILGQDLEQIRFPADSVEKSFVPLLCEFRDIGVRL